MKEFYRQYHEYEYHPHTHWAAFVGFAFAMAFVITGAANDFYAPEMASAQTSGLPSVSYLGYYDIQTYGNDSTYMRSLTHRYVGSELRFITMTHRGVLHEFKLPSSFGGKANTPTATWDISGTGAINNHTGFWYEQEKNRLWVASAEDYTNVNHPAKITLLNLGSNGSVSVIKQFNLNVPAKRVYGGCNKVPSSLVSRLGGSYVCGWGGYTSLVAQGGGASIGPTMYSIPDPDTIANGSTVSARTILDAVSSRGVRKTIPSNYFDGGDSRQNPSSRPTSAPLSSASWLSPNSEGLGWMTWGDSYYNTGVWIGNTYAAVASLCKGSCWYQSSTLAFDGRQFELHMWDGNSLGNSPLKRPDSMTELSVPLGNTNVWGGNSPAGNISGATYDSTTGTLYMIGFPLGGNVYTGRMYAYGVNGVSTTPIPSQPTTPTQPTPEPEQPQQPQQPVADSQSPTAPTNVSLTAISATQVLISWNASTDNVGVAGYRVYGCVGNLCTASSQYVETSGTTYQVSYGISPSTQYRARIRAYDAAGNLSTYSSYASITTSSGQTQEPQTPVDATVSAWSSWNAVGDWSVCSSGTQTRTEERTRTVTVAASNGGITPELRETRTASRNCTTPVEEPTIPALPSNFNSLSNDAKTTALLDYITKLQEVLKAYQSMQNSGTPQTTSSATGCSFTRNLSLASRGEDVRCLQKYLNSAGFRISSTGSGSPGSETTFYGGGTANQVSRWQRANGVSPATGTFGPLSRAKYNELVN